jgi:hypothetical protein
VVVFPENCSLLTRFCHGFSPNLTLGHVIAGIRMEEAILAWKEPPAVHELGFMLSTNRKFPLNRILVLRSLTNIILNPHTVSPNCDSLSYLYHRFITQFFRFRSSRFQILFPDLHRVATRLRRYRDNDPRPRLHFQQCPERLWQASGQQPSSDPVPDPRLRPRT